MKIKKHGHKIRRQRVMDTWLRMATDYNAGMTAKEIAIRYGKSESHVYWILRQLRETPVN